MRMSVGVTYSTSRGDYRIYSEKTVDDLLTELQRADLVVGFNHLRFDYEVEGDEVRLTTGSEVETKIDEAKAGVLKVGDPMPDFTLPSIPIGRKGAGDWVSLSSFRGKKLAIYAWASW